MDRTRGIAAVLAAAALLAASSAGAQSFGFGPRFGLGNDPDQIMFGIHADAGRINKVVRFQPDFEVGLGDHFTLATMTLPFHYLFSEDDPIRPYAGGGLVFGVADPDRSLDDTDWDVGFSFAAGLEWTLQDGGGPDFLLELNVLAGDLHDFEVVGGLTFR